MILNLLLNAADAMAGVEDRPRTLLVQTERLDDDGSIRLTVRDSGTGMDPLSPKSCSRPSTPPRADGMGIGLSISRSIIENHGGRLWAEPNEGPGATFAFTAPCRSDGPGPAVEPARAAISAQ